MMGPRSSLWDMLANVLQESEVDEIVPYSGPQLRESGLMKYGAVNVVSQAAPKPCAASSKSLGTLILILRRVTTYLLSDSNSFPL